MLPDVSLSVAFKFTCLNNDNNGYNDDGDDVKWSRNYLIHSYCEPPFLRGSIPILKNGFNWGNENNCIN